MTNKSRPDIIKSTKERRTVETLVIFSILTIFNVIFSTIKSIVTIKAGKTVASLVSAGYYGFYNIVLIYTVAAFPLWQKVIVTFFCNLIGVFAVKYAEEKTRKDKLWKIEATFDKKYLDEIHKTTISHSYIDIGNKVIFNFYAENQKESAIVKKIVNQYKGKYFVSESKNL